MPSPIEFWLCASSFNPFNVLIAQPVTDDTCEVIPRLTCSSCHLPPFLLMSKYGLRRILIFSLVRNSDILVFTIAEGL